MKKQLLRFKTRALSVVTGRPFLISAGILVGLFLLMNYIVLPLYVHHGGTRPVPGVIGVTLDSAKASLDDWGMQPVEADTRPDPDRPAGTVINQNPAPGSIVKEGRRVYLTISGGEVQVGVPSLRGRTFRDAGFALERNGLRVGNVTHTTSATFPENTIVEQSVAPNTLLPKGSAVGIIVSSGPDTLEMPAPGLTGKSTAEAERILMAAGLRVGNITLQPSFDLLPNTVVDQFPRAGVPISRGQAIDLFVVKSGRPAEEIHNIK